MASNAPTQPTRYPVPPGSSPTTYSGYFAIVAWTITIGIFVLAARTKIGYTFLYFFVIASIVVVLAIGSPTIVSIFRAATPQTQTQQA